MNGSKLIYSIMGIMSAMLMSIGGVSGHLIMARVEAIEANVMKMEQSRDEAVRERDKLTAQVSALCAEICRFREDFDNFRSDLSTKPIMRRACLCPDMR